MQPSYASVQQEYCTSMHIEYYVEKEKQEQTHRTPITAVIQEPLDLEDRVRYVHMEHYGVYVEARKRTSIIQEPLGLEDRMRH